ncbi:MAG: ribonuclease III [Candidatus Kerfeldbacteria bacterium RIFCSPLOWO2_01_FULL_48_11]|uniref:Ribonuclease 3 n=1 Tax=Candidatus Kerfeldbacteria bacterium RIFCSPLOWO2_01_FULL_48_11 TaxID=1798543 RepID=A0A1G2B677_9BACT|nr:MAG: Ribonuclease 3 [Parcubacteria group bacterium GW2011_GWA2_48_9]KKW16478.1 MAG: Ribonuclease 3 [Parcubacteria group bacterium GW2011_GWC2_49_9]OGY84703.1 MAG: ribonuclease III [Candidatus Kerfeldbacteria bacterium RIFCSPLOWO2_01_FULL_48_11]
MLEKDFSHLEQKLGVTFSNKDLLNQAMVHRSYLNEHPRFALNNNERLEFLGDAVLELVVTEYLYQTYPNPEGELTNWRASLVNAKMLAELARTFDLDHYLYLSRGEQKDKKSKARTFILADAFEALIGSMYLDQGWQVTQEFIVKHLIPHLRVILENHLYEDPKSHFQEFAQEKTGITPSYRVLHESGPDHARKFRIGIYIGEELIAEGEGTSKQEAQVRAAENALEVKGW